MQNERRVITLFGENLFLPVPDPFISTRPLYRYPTCRGRLKVR